MLDFLRFRKASSAFRTRSSERDSEVDAQRVASISRAIDAALVSSQSEQAGLRRRLDDVLARVAVTAGNDCDEYLHREQDDTTLQNQLNSEIAAAERRLHELETAIRHFQSLSALLDSLFPEHAPPASD
ncbi:hypothetical protein [Rhodopseudomonas palustris]|uniref:Uncharacterized protein n=1 Tax=Rhodopseudomonas palustris TaxID=1076 RepID=A0A418VQX4_RHOPL|nr:hypothetical protein [Rhodopseudomonas palustris]RJF78719.1 hypothetical protein D4Q52_00710 [Rhodopseudomonas palustris]